MIYNGIKNIFKKVKNNIIKIIIMILLLIIGISSKFYYNATCFLNSRTFYDFNQNVNSVTNTILDYNQNLLGFSSKYYREPIKNVPNLLSKTILNVEDKTFFTNSGVSIIGLIRAVLRFIPSLFKKERPIGGSTITQQIVRMMALNQDLSLFRKWKEIIYAIALTRKFPKSYILELYINSAYFGYNIYGFGTAAKFFFNKTIQEISGIETAILVAMLKSPSFSPLNQGQHERLKSRLYYIVDIMYENKMIDKNAQEYYKSIDINEIIDNKTNNKSSSYLTNYIRKHVIDNYGQDIYNNGGLKIQTTIDKSLQIESENIMRSYCVDFEIRRDWKGPIANNKKFDKNQLNSIQKKCGSLYCTARIIDTNGTYELINQKTLKLNEQDIKRYIAFKQIEIGDIVILTKESKRLCNIPVYTGQMMIVDLITNEVKALVGGVDESFSEYVVTNSDLTLGSMMKIFDVLGFFIQGIPTNTKVSDAPGEIYFNKFQYISKEKWETNKSINNKNSLEKMNVWPVNNWDYKFFGDITLRIAFEFSRNIPFIYFWNQIDHKSFHNLLVNFDFISDKQPLYPAILLGSLDVKPMKFMAAMASIFHNKKTNVNIIKSIENSSNNIIKPIIEEKPLSNTPLFKKSVRYALLSLMRGSIIRGSLIKLQEFGPYIYGKTGSASNNRNGQCVIIYGKYLIYTTICRYDNKPITPNNSSHSVVGSGYPVEIIKGLLKKIKIEPINYLSDKSNINIQVTKYNAFDSEVVDSKVFPNIESEEIISFDDQISE